ncbi:MAG: hypothetical protein KKA62_04535 [Nanoarchaeota archaeon]|nr:hypothetical protein [Nanoarchaeota archaeon]MBU1977188.1 hypothetical protein [Nanoarchaeota archaeon]
MSLIIKFSRAPGQFHVNRLDSSIKIIELIINLFEKSRIEEFYNYEKEASLSFNEREMIKFNEENILNIKKKIGQMNFIDRSSIGFEFEGLINIDQKEFKFICNIYPEIFSRRESFDLDFNIYPKYGVRSFADLVKYKNIFLDKLCNSIKLYNENKKASRLKIKKAIISLADEDFDVRGRVFSYYKLPAEFIEDVIKTSKLVGVSMSGFFKDRFALINEKKLSHLINRNENYHLGIDNIYGNSNTAAVVGSLCLIPQNENSMAQLFGDLKDKVLKPVADKLVSRKEVENSLNDLELEN